MIPKPVIELTVSLFRKLGYDLKKYHPDTSLLARRMKLFEHHGIEIVLDIGANEGQYAHRLRRLGYKGRIVSFEPIQSAFDKLDSLAKQDALWDTVKVALGDTSEQTVINVAGHSPSSSLLPMLPSHELANPNSKYVATETINIRRLDEIFESYVPTQQRVFMKVDTQGFEHKVLLGSSGCIDRISGLQLEMSLTPLYEGELLWDQMLDYTSSLGFSIFSIEPGYADPDGRTLQMDVILFRES